MRQIPGWLFTIVISAPLAVILWPLLRRLVDYTKARRLKLETPSRTVEVDIGSISQEAIEELLRQWGLPDIDGPAPPRYANVALLKVPEGLPLDRSRPIPISEIFFIRIDIGQLSEESQVASPIRFPDEYLPDEDVWLDVMVSSSRLIVAPPFQGDADMPNIREGFGPWGASAHGRLLLPADGRAARTESGSRFLYFPTLAPEPSELARTRINYYYRNSLLQSQRIDAVVGTGPGQFIIETDYTISATLTGLQAIPERPRLSLITNETGSSLHQITFRAGKTDGSPVENPGTLEVSHAAMGPLIRELREVLSSTYVAPVERKRSKSDLIYDLQKLAPLGWKIYAPLSGGIASALEGLGEDLDGVVVQVSRPTSATFTVPWNYLYDIPLSDDIRADDLEVCPVITDWDESRPMIKATERQCPRFDEADHYENLLCPFGFWGFRFTIEQLSSSEKPVFSIPVARNAQLVVGQTLVDVDRGAVSAHIKQLHGLFAARFPEIQLREGASRADIRQYSQNDVPFLYFYCHGQKDAERESEVYLAVGTDESITPNDFIGWVEVSWKKNRLKVWNNVRPLVFINACHSIEINPDTLTSYLNAFIGRANAAGVIGTEVKVSQNLAMDFGVIFFEQFLKEDARIGESLRNTRLGFLADGNLLGLAYNAHCWADLMIVDRQDVETKLTLVRT